MADIRFGTGGWRAVIGEDFSAENIRKVAQGVADMIKEDGQTDKPVAIGYDRRFLSDQASKWIAEVLCANGISVWLMKRSAPTPFIMHTVKKNDLYYGLEVTASHNPAIYNGIKVIVREGRDAPVELTNRLEERISEAYMPSVMPFEQAKSRGLVTYMKQPFNSFIDDIIEHLDMQAIRERDLRIAFDPMHGSGTYPLMVIMFTARCTIDTIHQNKDAYFGYALPAPNEDNLAELSYKVKSEKYDFGIAFDGDGDRVGIIDDNGDYVSANEILVMLYWYLHEHKKWKGPVVKNCATTHLLDIVAADLGEKCYEVPVGFKYISQKIDETDAVLGGESSGGLTVRGHIFGKDSIYSAALFTEMVSVLYMKVSEIREMLKKKYGSFAFVEKTFKTSREEKNRMNNLIMNEKLLPQFENVEKVTYFDGCKVYFKDGTFVLFRFSGTEPILRIVSEANTKEEALRYIDAFRSIVGL